MQKPQPQLDKHGFPVPPTFDAAKAARVRRRPRPWLALAVVIPVGLFLAALGARKELKAQFGKLVAARFERSASIKLAHDDLEGALAEVNQAIAWADRPRARLLRGVVQLERADWKSSLEDLNVVVRDSPWVADAFRYRSHALQRLGRHDEAIADATRVIELSSSLDPDPWNGRAYLRALAGVQLEDALQDVNRALELAEFERYAYLDTRGYIYFLLGRYDLALDDLESAVAEAEAATAESRTILKEQELAPQVLARFERQASETLAVILHHRGQVREFLGQKPQAEADLKRAKELGYNPERGVM